MPPDGSVDNVINPIMIVVYQIKGKPENLYIIRHGNSMALRPVNQQSATVRELGELNNEVCK